jgi:hypothetical protein
MYRSSYQQTCQPSDGVDNTLSLSAIEKSAFFSLPSIIQDRLQQDKRVVVVANNPSITPDHLVTLLQEGDIVVLFNDFIHGDFFSTHPLVRTLPKLLFFRQIGDSSLHFGLPPRSNSVAAIEKMAAAAPLGIMLSNQMYQFLLPSDDPSPNDDPAPAERILMMDTALKALFNDPAYCRALPEDHPVVADYPYFADIHSSAPSSGFLIYRLLLATRQYLQEATGDTSALELLMIGFNHDNKTPHFWHGHNWEFEREEMQALPTGVSLIQQF